MTGEENQGQGNRFGRKNEGLYFGFIVAGMSVVLLR